MYQSIPAAPYPPSPGNYEASARLACSGVLERPGGRAFANPGGILEKIVDVFKGTYIFLLLICTLT